MCLQELAVAKFMHIKMSMYFMFSGSKASGHESKQGKETQISASKRCS